MENSKINWQTMSDTAIVVHISSYIKHLRLEQNKSQAELAIEAGISRITLSQFELGKKMITLVTLIQLLRALGNMQVFDVFQIKTQISPLKLAQIEQDKRKRASGKSHLK
jgi:transcriptional regulator with XRE-family HTH domain